MERPGFTVTEVKIPKPPLAIRVGVTGHRLNKLDARNVPELHARARDALRAIASVMRGIAAGDRGRGAYEHGAAMRLVPRLRCLSPLAEGADRIVAQEALELGYSLEAPLPFTQREYERDFPDTLAEFRSFLAQATAVLELDGYRGEAERSYEAVGRFVVRNCDVLIALWDGEKAARGGTGEIVRFAAGSGVPIWWINAQRPTTPPRLIMNWGEYRRTAQTPAAIQVEAILADFLERTILPPPKPSVTQNAVLAKLGLRFARGDSPLDDYLRRKHYPLELPFWRANATFMNLVAPASASARASVAMLPAVGPIEKWWDRLYTPADRLSIAYGDRIRSSYLLVIALATLSLLADITASLIPADTRRIAVGFELLFLVLIVVLVVASHAGRWHERWIMYRLLAELCRKQRMLTPVGRSLPRWQIESVQAADEAPRDAWVAWYFSAAQRASAMPSGNMSEALGRAKDVGLSLVAEQTAYHEVRERRCQKAGERLQTLGEIFFLLTLVFVCAQFILLILHSGSQDALKLINVIGSLLPAGAAAFVSLRAYSEFELLENQSKRVQQIMQRAAEDLETVDLTESASLKSDELGSALHALATAMLQDVGGWAKLFGIKSLETG